MSYDQNMAESFMDMAGRLSQDYDRLHGILQTSLRMLKDLNERPNLEDYQDSYNRHYEVQDFIKEHWVDDPVKIITPVDEPFDGDTDNLPF